MSSDTLTPRGPKEPQLFVPQGSMMPAPPYCLNQKVKYSISSGLLQQPCYPLEISSHGPCANICSSNPASFWSASFTPHSPSASPSSVRPDHRVGQVEGESHQKDAQPHSPCHCPPVLPTALHHSYLSSSKNNSPSSSLESCRPH